MGHSRFAASDSARWLNCPGSVLKEEALVAAGRLPAEGPSSQYADEGTAAHAVLARCVRDMLAGAWGVSADAYKGRYVQVESAGSGLEWSESKPAPRKGWRSFQVDDDMTWAVDVAVGVVRETLESMGAAAGAGVPADVRVEVEKHVDLSHLGRGDLGGTADVRIVRYMDRAVVIDYKHGRGVPVYAEFNTQLMIYGLGDDACADDLVGDVELVIVQPRCQENDAVGRWTRSAEVLRDWGRNVLLPRVQLAETPGAPLVAGEKQCLWCRCAGGLCEEAHGKALALAGQEFPDLPDDPASVQAAVAAMPPDRLADFLRHLPFFDAVISAATGRAVELLAAGKEVPGFKLVAGRSNRKWADGAEEAMKKKRVPKSVMYEEKLASFTKVEKADGGKYKALVDQLTFKPPGKPTLAPESDRRPALPPAAQEEFDAVGGDDLLS